VVVVESVAAAVFASADEALDVDVGVGVVVDVDVVATEGCSFWIGAAQTPSEVATEHGDVLGPFVTAPPAASAVSVATPTMDTDRSAATPQVKSLKIESLIWDHHRSRVREKFYPRKVADKSTGR
jgi:hypothetical protein